MFTGIALTKKAMTVFVPCVLENLLVLGKIRIFTYKNIRIYPD